METYKIWEGERTWLPGDDTSKYTVFEIVAEELGMLEDADWDSGKTYYVYCTAEGEIIINLINWKSGIGEPHYGSIHRYGSLEEAAQSEFHQALKDMRLI